MELGTRSMTVRTASKTDADHTHALGVALQQCHSHSTYNLEDSWIFLTLAADLKKACAWLSASLLQLRF